MEPSQVKVIVAAEWTAAIDPAAEKAGLTVVSCTPVAGTSGLSFEVVLGVATDEAPTMVVSPPDQPPTTQLPVEDRYKAAVLEDLTGPSALAREDYRAFKLVEVHNQRDLDLVLSSSRTESEGIWVVAGPSFANPVLSNYDATPATIIDFAGTDGVLQSATKTPAVSIGAWKGIQKPGRPADLVGLRGIRTGPTIHDSVRVTGGSDFFWLDMITAGPSKTDGCIDVTNAHGRLNMRGTIQRCRHRGPTSRQSLIGEQSKREPLDQFGKPIMQVGIDECIYEGADIRTPALCDVDAVLTNVIARGYDIGGIDVLGQADVFVSGAVLDQEERAKAGLGAGHYAKTLNGTRDNFPGLSHEAVQLRGEAWIEPYTGWKKVKPATVHRRREWAIDQVTRGHARRDFRAGDIAELIDRSRMHAPAWIEFE